MKKTIFSLLICGLVSLVSEARNLNEGVVTDNACGMRCKKNINREYDGVNFFTEFTSTNLQFNLQQISYYLPDSEDWVAINQIYDPLSAHYTYDMWINYYHNRWWSGEETEIIADFIKIRIPYGYTLENGSLDNISMCCCGEKVDNFNHIERIILPSECCNRWTPFCKLTKKVVVKNVKVLNEDNTLYEYSPKTESTPMILIDRYPINRSDCNGIGWRTDLNSDGGWYSYKKQGGFSNLKKDVNNLILANEFENLIFWVSEHNNKTIKLRIEFEE